MVINSPTAARSVVSITCTASAGKPASSKPLEIHKANAWLESMASEPPRKIVAFPDFKHKLAASIVTFGRDS